jgi:hypothetical protein
MSATTLICGAKRCGRPCGTAHRGDDGQGLDHHHVVVDQRYGDRAGGWLDSYRDTPRPDLVVGTSHVADADYVPALRRRDVTRARWVPTASECDVGGPFVGADWGALASGPVLRPSSRQSGPGQECRYGSSGSSVFGPWQGLLKLSGMTLQRLGCATPRHTDVTR